MSRAIITAAVTLAVLPVAADAQCYRSYPSRSYSYPSYSYSYPSTYHDNRLTIQYSIAFPPPAISGATSFAYQAQQFPFLDGALVLNSSARLVETAQALAGAGLREHTAAFTQILGAQAQVAEAQTQAASLAELARIAKETRPGQSVTITRSASGHFQRVEPAQTGERSTRIQAAFNEACVKCHSPGGEYPKLDLRDLSTLEEKWEPLIMQRILSDDPAKVMPPPRSGRPLPPEVIVDLIKASSLLRGGNGNGEVPPQKIPAPPGPVEPLKE